MLSLSSVDALADKRVALVIGNSAYKNVARLPNPANDAKAIAELLKKAGFETVIAKSDVANVEMRRAVREFTEAAATADMAVVFYAGHGIEINGGNYLIPTDAVLESDLDVDDETLSLDRIMHAMEPVKRLRLVILDACRDNPFSRSMKHTLASRSIGRGLAQVEPVTSDTLVAFAAKAGSTASDGSGGHSPFTAALLKYIAVPGLDIRLALGRVRDEVYNDTDRKQEPFVYGSLGGSDVSLVPKKEAPPPADNSASAARDYEFAERIGTKEAWDVFLENHKAGFYSQLAKAARDKLIAAADAEAKRRAIEDARKQAQADAEAKQRADAKHKAELEAKRQADAEAEAQRQAEIKKQAEAEAKRLAAAAEAKRKAEEAAKQQAAQRPTVIAMAPPQANPEPARSLPAIASADIARLLQFHLKRVGCDPGSTDGAWNEGSIHALGEFNKHAGTKLDVKVASLDALHAVEQHQARVCPLVCGRDEKIEGDHCVAIHKAAKPERKREAGSAEQSGGGQIFCSERSGCSAVPKNCHLEYSPGYGGSGGVATMQQHMVCN